MAELFWWVEVVKPSFVQPRVFDPNGTVQLHSNCICIVNAKMELNIECMIYLMFFPAACEPVPSRNMAPVSSPVKQSYADRPDSPVEGKYYLLSVKSVDTSVF